MARSAPATPPRRHAFHFRDVLLIRLINACTLATFFQPDEFFQVLEPAWHLAFGPDSGAWLTWEWHHQLRSSLHPLLFSGAYLIADSLTSILPASESLRASALILAPRILQAVIAALGDWFTFKLARRIFSPDETVPLAALLLQLLSPWQWYCSTRTFSNSLEATLTIIALYHWPWALLTPHSSSSLSSSPSPSTKENPKPPPILQDPTTLRSLRTSLLLAALAAVLRPTNILLWLPLALAALPRALSSPRDLLLLAREALLCATLVLAAAALADRWFFARWTFPPWNWLAFNVSRDLAVFYGRNPWHYYLLQGLPLLCTTSLPFALPALLQHARGPAKETQAQDEARRNMTKQGSPGPALTALARTVGVSVAALSLISHKEVRFIYPLLPILSILSAPRAASFFITTTTTTTISPSPSPSSSKSSSASAKANPPRRRLRLAHKPLLALAIATNALIAGYLSFLHQPAPLSVLAFLRTQYAHLHPSARLPSSSLFQPQSQSQSQSQSRTQSDPSSPDEDLFALFLTPCHSTPWRSHLLYPSLSARALTCHPPLHTAPNSPARLAYRDEADRFYDDPPLFLRTELFGPQTSNTSSNTNDTNSTNDNSNRNKDPRPLRPRFVIAFEGVEPWLNAFLATPDGEALGWRPRRAWAGFNGFANEDWRRRGHLVVWDTGLYSQEPR